MSGSAENHSLALLMQWRRPDPKSVSSSCRGLSGRLGSNLALVKFPLQPSPLTSLHASFHTPKGSNDCPCFLARVGGLSVVVHIQCPAQRLACRKLHLSWDHYYYCARLVVRQTYCRGPGSKYCSFARQAILVTTSQPCHCKAKATDNKQMNGRGCVPIKTY